MAPPTGPSSECPSPFYRAEWFNNSMGYVEGRICQQITDDVSCCLPCPMTDWVYPDNFNTLGLAAEWVAVVSTICCVFILASWVALPVEKSGRHYLSIGLSVGVLMMGLGFVIPLAAKPNQCADLITPNSMATSGVCAASGTMLILGGWCAVVWVFLRSLSLHLQICWQVVVGRNFMWFSQAIGWGVPILGIILALTLSGVSFRFGATCHINHQNSLAVLWIPLLVFAGLTIVLQFTTFGYCIKVYLASLSDNSASTEGSGLPSYTNSIKTMTPRQAYRRVRRVIQLQWRGIAIVLIIITDVIFFSIIFVFQDNTVETVKANQALALPLILCLVTASGDKNQCLNEASALVVNMATVGAVLILLAVNGFWLLLLLGRGSMFTGWGDLMTAVPGRSKREFVSVDARIDDLKKDQRSYEMLSRDSGKTMDDSVTESIVTPISPMARSPMPLRSPSAVSRDPVSPPPDGRRTPDYFGQTARYHAPARSFSSPRPPPQSPNAGWQSPRETYQRQRVYDEDDEYVNPLAMNRI
ncbi:putative G-protein coupled receptor [Thozetella sp. PMI_491]|nr:putative G-protein coupled receptor [Thozetella sp. PMI_491]